MAFCTSCGVQIPDGAAFCMNCGSPAQAAQAQQPTQQPQSQYQQPSQQPYQQPGVYAPAGAPNPSYQKLGGWLLVLVVLEALSTFSYVGYLADSVSGLGALSSYGGAFLFVGAVSVLANILGIVYAAGFIFLVVKRNPVFLRFYQIMGIASMALALANVIGSYLLAATSTSTSATIAAATMVGAGAASIAGVVLAIAFLVLFTMYFCKSVRVRTYMGSTAYIDRALFRIGA